MPIGVDMDPCALELWAAIRAPHRVVAILLDELDHFLARVHAALDDFLGVINLVPPEVADVFMPCAARHPTRCTFDCCCHSHNPYIGADG